MAAWIVSVSVAVLCGSFFSQIVTDLELDLGNYLGVTNIKKYSDHLTILANVNCTGSASVEYFSSSTWNKEDASKANDDNNVTCSVTGFGASPWWKVDLGEAKLVEKVKLYGEITEHTLCDTNCDIRLIFTLHYMHTCTLHCVA
ncbi:hypothetical protein CAPTEDRAFT_210839 [Capitella teleta]|uniref:Fucolectin tachylectin-4 pentraxin-1 domain-containing protein n=1 Tax=Capitella teleta TaxID=283909 RepID=R7U1L8_CAPTE|nr:hypothetical protein CAPTEDRAFT_210839 [Capitella teleta]|eukprot:ELT99854.1 hypothetical protein CAPTEDRAFT_210839 [Capitella teleta]